jgi:hypothetical protein
MPSQPLSTFTFNFFSKSICACFLRNYSLKTSLIALTKRYKHLNVVLFPILQYSSQALIAWPYASMRIAHVHFWMELNVTTPHAFLFYTK